MSRVRLTSWVFVVLICCGAGASFGADSRAEQAQLLADAPPGPESSGPFAFTPSSDLMFFVRPEANDSSLWRSDGTAAGTFSLGAQVWRYYDERGAFGSLDGRVFFTGWDEDNLVEVWTSDGTIAGTHRLTTGLFEGGDLDPYLPRPVLASESLGLVFFVVGDAAHGTELWATNGEPAGTHIVADLTPGPASSRILALVESRGKVFFLRRGMVDEFQLFVTDGTEVGTALLHSGPFLNSIAATTKSLFFFQGVPIGAGELWKSDGTIAGTKKVANLPSDTTNLPSPDVRAAEDRLYFLLRTAADGGEIWTSDGSAAGTRQLTHFSDPEAVRLWSWGSAVGSRLVIPVFDAALGGEVWVSDGTAAGTVPLNLCPGSCGFARFQEPFVTGNRFNEALFAFDDGVHGYELWRTDGTVAGTRRLTDLCPGACSSYPTSLQFLAGGWMISADDGAHGRQLWWLDEGAPLERVTNLPPNWPGDHLDALAAGNHFFFGADDGVHGGELWGVTIAPEVCVPDDRTLCLNDGRFRVRARQQAQGAPLADAHGVKLTDDSGYFWFFGPDNVELVVKLLDACGTPAQNFWAFAAGLTNVRVELEMRDTVSGETRTYVNPQNQPYRFLADTGHFQTCQATAAATADVTAAPLQAACAAGPDVLCLDGGRFEVRASWKIAGGQTGVGHPQTLTDDTGTFWFFDSTNLEVVLKVLDACSLAAAPRYWVFAAGLTNVEVTLTVTDTQTHTVKTYHNDLDQDFVAIQDTGAFPTCP